MARDTKSRALTIRITEEERTLLEDLAVREDRTAASVLRVALREYADRHPPRRAQIVAPRKARVAR